MTLQKMNPAKKVPRLSQAEWTVMKPLWDNKAMAARDIYQALPPSHGWAYKTVKTMLARLVKKGALEYTQVGNSYLYKPCHSRKEMTHSEVRGFKERVLDGALQPFLVSFFEGRQPSREEISVLREVLDKYEPPQRQTQRKRRKEDDGEDH